MDSDRYQKIRQLFHEVCDLEAIEREQRLAETCTNDAALRQQVEDLLSADGKHEDLFAEKQVFEERPSMQQSRPGAESLFAQSASRGHYLPGTRIANRYRIVSLLGVGGMGQVYRADDMKLGHPVALKFLPRQLSRNSRNLEYFLNEVRFARQISHPNVCRVYDIGEADGIHFLSMEYIDGEDLRSLLKRIGFLPRAKGIEIARQLCRGLAAAHYQGILHRDLKPANVMIDGRGQARITDFGLARLFAEPGSSVEIAGTPAYMAPEQLSGGETTILSDIYSLGLVLYELFTGRAFNQGAITERLRQSDLPSLPAPPSGIVKDVDPSIDRVVLGCLEADPQLRPPSADAVALALPGRNSLDAALAAGEMPLPELVAAAGDQQGMSRRPAAIMLTAILIGLFILGALSRKIQSAMKIEVNELIRVSDAERVTDLLGFQPERVDSTWGLQWYAEFFSYFDDDSAANLEWRQLTGRPPRPTTFWYRESVTDLVPRQGRGPYSSMFVTRDDPPVADPGSCGLVLDSDGKLLQWQTVPLPADAVRPEVDPQAWRRSLFEVAGFDPPQFDKLFERDIAQEKSHAPPVFADTWEVWRSKSTPTIIEAAALRGKPVYFRVGTRQPFATSPTSAARPIILAITILTLFSTALFLAHRNWKSGTADRRGSLRLFLFVLVTSLIYWLCQAHHVKGPGEAVMILETLARAMLRGTLICAAYVGLEPYVRKAWPRVLVGWNRLLSNGFFDRNVARDILVGISGGLVAQFIGSFAIIFGFTRQFALTADPVLRVGEGPFPLEPLTGILFATGQVSRELFVGLVGGFFACLVFVFVLNLIVRNRWIAAMIVVLFFSYSSIASGDLPAGIIVALWVSLGFVLLFQFGVLAVVTGWIAWQIVSWPVGFSLSTPYVDIGGLGYAFVFCVALVAGCLACRPSRATIHPVLNA